MEREPPGRIVAISDKWAQVAAEKRGFELLRFGSAARLQEERASGCESRQYIEDATKTEMKTMAHRAESFWQRRLSKRASRVLLLLLLGGLVLTEGWLGRKRLFVVHDRQYLLAFILFGMCAVILLGALRVIAARLHGRPARQ
jgi:hypothetical protein